jgi:hypothetical protein
MKILFPKILLEELCYRFESMTLDQDFIEDNLEIIDIINSVYNKLLIAYNSKSLEIELTEAELKEIKDEMDSCETMDYWLTKPMINAIKVFNIQVGRLVKVTKEEYEKMCEGYYINRNMCPKPERVKHKGYFYVYKDDYDFHFPVKVQ